MIVVEWDQRERKAIHEGMKACIPETLRHLHVDVDRIKRDRWRSLCLKLGFHRVDQDDGEIDIMRAKYLVRDYIRVSRKWTDAEDVQLIKVVLVYKLEATRRGHSTAVDDALIEAIGQALGRRMVDVRHRLEQLHRSGRYEKVAEKEISAC